MNSVFYVWMRSCSRGNVNGDKSFGVFLCRFVGVCYMKNGNVLVHLGRLLASMIKHLNIATIFFM
jgi:hypothetical protein